MLRRATIVAGELISIGKETDRSWDQGGDPSILDFKLKEYGKVSKMVIAEPSDRKKWAEVGVREIMRKSRLSQKAIYAILQGRPVRKQTLATIKRAMEDQADFLAKATSPVIGT